MNPKARVATVYAALFLVGILTSIFIARVASSTWGGAKLWGTNAVPTNAMQGDQAQPLSSQGEGLPAKENATLLLLTRVNEETERLRRDAITAAKDPGSAVWDGEMQPDEVLRRLEVWLKDPSRRGLWRDRWYPPNGQDQPMELRGLTERGGWKALRERYDGTLQLAEEPNSEKGGVPSLKGAVGDLRGKQNVELLLEFLLDEKICGRGTAWAAAYISGPDAVLSCARLALIGHHAPDLAMALMALELGGERTPKGPG